jgi:phenylacetic acid degradation operon negative regulatory protein
VATLPASLRYLTRGLNLRANSLLLTLYGDAVAPSSQAVALRSLIALAEPFGINARLVRTCAFRLAANDWLSAIRVGRNSYYGLTPAGLQRVMHAAKRIYSGTAPAWDGYWTLVLLRADTRASLRQHLGRELAWEGFGTIAPGVYAHPNADLKSLGEIVSAAGAEKNAAVMRAQSVEAFAPEPLQALMHQTFKLAAVAPAWRAFCTRFESVLPDAKELAPADAYFVRTLLIHEYRRVLLRDPNLPEALLPADWPGRQARALCAGLYRSLLKASEQYLDQQIQSLDGQRGPQTRASVRRRFDAALP